MKLMQIAVPSPITKKSLSRALKHIDDMWAQLEVFSADDQETLIGLPYPYYVPSSEPNQGFIYRELYYWDSYFVIVGLLASGRVHEARGIVDNFLTLAERFGMVPNANRYYMLSRSQPPVLTTMIRDVHAQTKDDGWQTRAIDIAKREYHSVWMGTQQPHNRLYHDGLSRYYDINMLHDLAEAESGWDYTPRFANHSLDFLPVDLNAFLYKYEADFAELAVTEEERDYWTVKARTRADSMRRHMFDENAGLYLDFDATNYERSDSYSLASYAPLFVGMLSEQDAAAAVARLRWFETPYGLSTTSLKQGMHIGRQWAMPNGWAPLHYMTVMGLKRYGFDKKARSIARKWLKLNIKMFEKTGNFYEKYNVVKGNQQVLDGVYPSQVGFAWTNGVFVALAKEFGDPL